MHDKNYNGSIDLDECVTLLYARFGKVLRMPASRPVPFAPPSPSTRHSPPASRLPPLASRRRPSPLATRAAACHTACQPLEPAAHLPPPRCCRRW